MPINQSTLQSMGLGQFAQGGYGMPWGQMGGGYYGQPPYAMPQQGGPQMQHQLWVQQHGGMPQQPYAPAPQQPPGMAGPYGSGWGQQRGGMMGLGQFAGAFGSGWGSQQPGISGGFGSGWGRR